MSSLELFKRFDITNVYNEASVIGFFSLNWRYSCLQRIKTFYGWVQRLCKATSNVSKRPVKTRLKKTHYLPLQGHIKCATAEAPADAFFVEQKS